MMLPEVVALTPLAPERVNGSPRSAGLGALERNAPVAGEPSRRDTSVSHSPMVRGRLRGLAAALRFSFIPLFCALVVAVASQDPRGRTLALWIAAGLLCLGVAVHIHEIVFGSSTRPPSPWVGAWSATPPLGAEEMDRRTAVGAHPGVPELPPLTMLWAAAPRARP